MPSKSDDGQTKDLNPIEDRKKPISGLCFQKR